MVFGTRPLPVGSAAAGPLRDAPERDDALVLGALAREHQAQGHEGEVRRPGAEHPHSLVEGARRGSRARRGQERAYEIGLRGRAVEEIAVEQLEIHTVRFAARAALLCALLSTAVGSAAPDDLNALLARMRARSGPVWSTHLTSTSRVALGGETAELRSESQGVRFASYRCSGALCVGTYFDGERLYSININGTVLPESDSGDPFLRGERTIASLAFLDPAFSDDGGSILDLGTATISGTTYRELLVDNGDATAMHVFVDPATATVRYLSDVNGDTTFEYRDYRRVDGDLYLPFLVLRNGSPIERYAERGVTSDRFAPPHGLTPRYGSGAPSIATDPEQTIPLFACTVQNVPATCLLDSGNSGLAISKELAERLRAPQVGSYNVRGLGDYATDVVRVGELGVANVTFPPANYVVLDDIHRFGYDVVLGADVLAATTVSLDPVNHRISFSALPPSGGAVLPLEFEDFVPTVLVQLGNLGTQLALDTGDESNINLDYDFYQAHRSLFAATEQRSVAGVGGTGIELLGTIPRVRIGSIATSAQPIGATRMHGTAYGHLGAGFLSQFDVTIDYAAGLVHVLPTPAPRR